MLGNQKAGVRQGRLFCRIKKLEYAVEKDRARLQKRFSKKKSFSDPKILRINRRLVKKCIRLYDARERYKKLAKKNSGFRF